MKRHSMTSLEWKLASATTYEDLFDLMDEVAAEYPGMSDDEVYQFIQDYHISRQAARHDAMKEARRDYRS